MKTIVKGKKVQVNYELSYKENDEPIIKETFEEISDIEIKVIEGDLSLNKGEEVYLDENTTIKILKVTKTLDGIIYVYTDHIVKEVNEEEKDFIEKMYERAYEKYSKQLLKKYPNVANIMKLMGKDNLSPKEMVEAVKSFNGVQNDFFMK